MQNKVLNLNIWIFCETNNKKPHFIRWDIDILTFDLHFIAFFHDIAIKFLARKKIELQSWSLERFILCKLYSQKIKDAKIHLILNQMIFAYAQEKTFKHVGLNILLAMAEFHKYYYLHVPWFEFEFYPHVHSILSLVLSSCIHVRCSHGHVIFTWCSSTYANRLENKLTL